MLYWIPAATCDKIWNTTKDARRFTTLPNMYKVPLIMMVTNDIFNAMELVRRELPASRRQWHGKVGLGCTNKALEMSRVS